MGGAGSSSGRYPYLMWRKESAEKLRKEDPHMLSARILSVAYADNHDEQPCHIFSMEQKPTFLGRDMNSFSAWVDSQLVYPEISKKAGSEGMVRLRLTIEKMAN